MEKIVRITLAVVLSLLSIPFLTGFLPILQNFEKSHQIWSQHISLISTSLPNLGSGKSIFQSLHNRSGALSKLSIRFRLPSTASNEMPLRVSLLTGVVPPGSLAELRSRTISTRQIRLRELVSGDYWTWSDFNLSDGGLYIEYLGPESDGVGLWGTDSTGWKQPQTIEDRLAPATLLQADKNGLLHASQAGASLSMEFGNDGLLQTSDIYISKILTMKPSTVATVLLPLGWLAIFLWMFLCREIESSIAFRKRALLYLTAGFLFFVAVSILVSGLPDILLNRGVHAESFYGQF